MNQGQEFVIAGYTKAPGNFDALIFCDYEDVGKLKPIANEALVPFAACASPPDARVLVKMERPTTESQ